MPDMNSSFPTSQTFANHDVMEAVLRDQGLDDAPFIVTYDKGGHIRPIFVVRITTIGHTKWKAAAKYHSHIFITGC